MKRFIHIFYTSFIAITLLFAFSSNVKAQDVIEEANEDSCYYNSAEISLLTCQPHDEVYSLYGHTAIRLFIPERNVDIAVNWGIFDSRKPLFALRFVFGITDYMMGIVPMEYFLEEYKYYGSGVYEQRLSLTPKEKKAIIDAIEENYKPENREYRYNFFYDNCTTRARDIILCNIEGKLSISTTKMQQGERSFRDLIHWKNHEHPWAALGNDLLLGVGSDRTASMEERQFLPEILMNDFDSTYVNEKALVDTAYWVLKPGIPSHEGMADFPLSPSTIAFILLAITALISLLEFYTTSKSSADNKSLLFRKIGNSINIILYTLCSLCGVIVFAMLFSQHPTVKFNLQILILNPLWILLLKHSLQSARYYIIALSVIFLFLLGNIFQSYAEGMNILALILLTRILFTLFKLHNTMFVTYNK